MIKPRNVKDIPRSFLKAYYKYRPIKRDFVINKEWKNLVVLDACRFDLFNNYNTIPGVLKKINSAGSNTREWYTNNFVGGNFQDVIYLSANPQISNFMLINRFGYNPFFKLVDVWKEGWSEELGSVSPEKVNESTLRCLKIHPEKKYIIHYLQPHYPYIGEIKLKSAVMTLLRKGILNQKTRGDSELATPWKLVEEGLIDLRAIRQAYISNLKFVLNTIKKLLPKLSGKIIITSDHGNSFGKFGLFYGHPIGFSLPDLVEVPWLEVDQNLN